MNLSSTKYLGGHTAKFPQFGQNNKQVIAKETEARVDSFYLNFDPKSLFNNAKIPSALRIINLNTDTREQTPISPRMLKNLRPSDNASISVLSANSEQIFTKAQAENQRQEAIRTGVKLALIGIGCVVGGYFLAHGVLIGGVLITDPTQLLRFATLFGGFIYGIAEAASRFFSNPTVTNRIQDTFRSNLKKLRSNMPLSINEKLRFQGERQKSRQTDPSAQMLTILFDTVEEYCSRLDKASEPSEKCLLILDMEKTLVQKLGQILKQSQSNMAKRDVNAVDAFLENYQGFYNAVPMNAVTFKDLSLDTREKLQKTLFYALNTPCPELQKWGETSANNIGVPKENVQAILKLRNQ